MALLGASIPLGFRRAIANVAVYSLGFAVPVGLMFGWLAAEGALIPYFDQAFLKGSQSKGGLRAIFFGWFPWMVEGPNLHLGGWLSAGLAAIALIGWGQRWVTGLIWPGAARRPAGRGEVLSIELLALLAASTMAVVFPYILPAPPSRSATSRSSSCSTSMAFPGSSPP